MIIVENLVHSYAKKLSVRGLEITLTYIDSDESTMRIEHPDGCDVYVNLSFRDLQALKEAFSLTHDEMLDDE